MSKSLTRDNGTSRQSNGIGTRTAVLLTAGVAVIGLAGFAGWFANGDTLFWSLLQAGLAWCM